MTLPELTALVLLYRACRDEKVRRRVLGLLPELSELVETVVPFPAQDKDQQYGRVFHSDYDIMSQGWYMSRGWYFQLDMSSAPRGPFSNEEDAKAAMKRARVSECP